MISKTKSKIATVFALAVSDGIPKMALIVAVIVGSLLNCINQEDALFGDGTVNVGKMTLTYMVPYCVSTFGSVSAIMRLRRENSEN